VTRGYDDAGRLASVQDWLTNTTSFAYDVNSNLTTETLPVGTGVTDTFTFDTADRLTAISDTKGTSVLFSAAYTRDNANQLTSDSPAPALSGAYKYTSLNQLCYAGTAPATPCSLPPVGATAYSYDAADNLVQMGSTQQTFNNADELCWTAATSGNCAAPPSGATMYAYDGRGNRTTVTPPSGGATNLLYDQANRLTGYGSTATYAYNGDGLRMRKTVGGSTSQFLWDVASAVPLLVKDASTAYVYGPGGLALEQLNGSTVLWMHHGQVGSTRLVSDRGGTTQASYTYDAYGYLTATTGTISNPLRFAGQYQDGESGLYYARARYYDSSTGQFISRDPIVSATRSPYAYVLGDPLNFTDPLGLTTPPWDYRNWPEVDQLEWQVGNLRMKEAQLVADPHDLYNTDPKGYNGHIKQIQNLIRGVTKRFEALRGQCSPELQANVAEVQGFDPVAVRGYASVGLPEEPIGGSASEPGIGGGARSGSGPSSSFREPLLGLGGGGGKDADM